MASDQERLVALLEARLLEIIGRKGDLDKAAQIPVADEVFCQGEADWFTGDKMYTA